MGNIDELNIKVQCTTCTHCDVCCHKENFKKVIEELFNACNTDSKIHQFIDLNGTDNNKPFTFNITMCKHYHNSIGITGGMYGDVITYPLNAIPTSYPNTESPIYKNGVSTSCESQFLDN